MMSIIYLHGLEGNANGTKGSYLQKNFGAIAPQMPASRRALAKDRAKCFQECLEVARKAVKEHNPDVIIGSSFGGGITLALMQEGSHKGHAILLAPAGIKYGLPTLIPEGNRVIIIHDPTDDVVDFQDSVRVLNDNLQSGTKNIELIETDGGHRLSNLTKNKLLERCLLSFRL